MHIVLDGGTTCKNMYAMCVGIYMTLLKVILIMESNRELLLTLSLKIGYAPYVVLHSRTSLL